MENEVLEKYRSIKSTRKVAEIFKISQTTVRRILRKHNEKAHDVRTPKNIQDIIITDYENGISSEQIAKSHNISPSTVCRVLKRNNHTIKGATYFNRI